MMKKGARARDLFLSSFNLSNRKRSLSTIVASLIMILLTIVAVGIVSQIVFPMIKKDLSSAGNCLGAIGNVEFSTKYTCYDKASKKIKVGIETKKVLVSGFVLNIFGSGNSKTYKIEEGKLDGVANAEIKLPKENEARVYEIAMDIIPETATLSPIIRSETCEVADNLILSKC